MVDLSEMYVEKTTPANEIKGFTKSFVKRTKDKKEEDVNVKELLNYAKEKRITIGAKVTEKNFKKELVEKVYVASNCDEVMLKKMKYYAKLLNVEVVELDLDNEELAQKLVKPFLISVISVRKK